MPSFALTLLLLLSTPLTASEPVKMLDFPAAADGRSVFAVDLHTHSVFSDGRVWPSLRVEEATRDGISAVAITEHLEWQPHAADLPHPDRNRPYEIASETSDGTGVTVINGAEITRGPQVGHINAVFLSDANRLFVSRVPAASTGKELEEHYYGIDKATREDVIAALTEARDQGAFTFLNHPSWVGMSADGRGRLSDFQRELIGRKLLDGVEVGNGGFYSVDAFRMALDHDLTILGTSDVHGLVAWDYADDDDDLLPGGRGARTATLVLADNGDSDSLRQALRARHTVALNDNTLFGRRPELSALLGGALSFELGERAFSYVGESSVYDCHIHNESPIPLLLRNVSGQVLADSTNTFIVPARGSVTVDMAGLEDPDALREVEVEVLNAYTAPDVPVKVALRRR